MKLDSIHREGIRIYTGAFKTSPIESLHVEANEPSLEKRRTELGLRYLYRLRGNPTYTDTLVTLDNTEDYNYEENEKVTRPVGVHYRLLEQRYMEEQKEIEKNNMPIHPPWKTNNITFCYEGEFAPKNLEKKQHFLQHKNKHQKEKEVYTDGSKNPGKKVGLVAVFEDTTRRGTLPEEASIHTAEMTAIKIALMEIKRRKEES